MFERIGRGWRMVGASWTVLKAHPKLLLFPILSGLAFFALIAAIAASVFYNPGSLERLSDTARPDEPLLYAAGFAFYFVSTFIIVFFNAALVFCALEGLAGRTPSLMGGVGMAARRLPQILAWTLVATTVGLLLSALQSFLRDKLGIFGAILGGVGEVAWSLTTYFVVPVLVVDGAGPVTAVKRSASILRQTWGESLGGAGGLGIISFLFFLPVVLLIAVVVAINRSIGVSEAMVLTLAAGVCAYLLALTIVFSALGTIFRVGAYVYATTGTAPSAMDPALLRAAFRKK
jgi:hypothetical protein